MRRHGDAKIMPPGREACQSLGGRAGGRVAKISLRLVFLLFFARQVRRGLRRGFVLRIFLLRHFKMASAPIFVVLVLVSGFGER